VGKVGDVDIEEQGNVLINIVLSVYSRHFSMNFLKNDRIRIKNFPYKIYHKLPPKV